MISLKTSSTIKTTKTQTKTDLMKKKLKTKKMLKMNMIKNMKRRNKKSKKRKKNATALNIRKMMSFSLIPKSSFKVSFTELSNTSMILANVIRMLTSKKTLI